MDFTPLNVTLAILGISLLVIVHEAGHYLAARAFGMRVLRFSIGLGPALWKHQPKGSDTIFQVCALPLLAYVQIDGMNPTEAIDPKDDELYANKGVFGRIVTIFAGPLANYLAAGLMVFTLCLVGGYPDVRTLPYAQVGVVMEDSAASEAELQVGDRILEVDGTAVSNHTELVAANADRGGVPTPYLIQRDGEQMEITLTPRESESGQVLMGVQLASERYFHTMGASEAIGYAFLVPWRTTVNTLEGLAHLVQEPDPDQVQSVVGMTKMLADSMEVAPQLYVALLIHLSVALGLFNLLPFPALDGGRLAFLGYELVTRRRANEKVEAVVHTVGLLFLLGVLVLVMAKDVIKMI
ncbi:MAG: RIP metalloprotease [Sandaracinaceae bacterium]